MNRDELIKIIKEYLLFKISHKHCKCGYMGVNIYTPNNFYAPLRQWANIHKVSLLAEVAEQAMFVLKGKRLTPQNAQIILNG